VAIVLLVAIYFMPKSQPVTEEARAELNEEVSSTEEMGMDQRIEKAVALVLNGTQPMQGIMMLRDLLKEEPENVKIHLVLGMFSIQSGQYEKAIERFKTALELDPNQAEAYLYLSEVYEKEGKADLAIENLNKYKDLIDDSAVISQVDEILIKLKNI